MRKRGAPSQAPAPPPAPPAMLCCPWAWRSAPSSSAPLLGQVPKRLVGIWEGHRLQAGPTWAQAGAGALNVSWAKMTCQGGDVGTTSQPELEPEP